MFYFRVWRYFTSEFGIVFYGGNQMFQGIVRSGKYKLGITNYEVGSTKGQLRITKWEVQIGNYELRITNWELRITKHELVIKNWEMRCIKYKPSKVKS